MAEYSNSTNSTENPYHSPAAADSASFVVEGYPGITTTAVVTSRDPLRRVWELSGGVEATLAWNASWITEYVTVNSRRVASHQPWFYAPLFEFEFPTVYGPVPGAVEIRLSRFIPVFVRGIAVRVNGETIYQEGRW